MEVSALTIFRIDIDQSAVTIMGQQDYGSDFEAYFEGLVRIVTSGSSGRSFRFDRETTEVRMLIAQIAMGSDFRAASSAIANRLLTCEKTTQEKIAKLSVEIQKGILVQAIISQDGVRQFIICKADHTDFLDELNFARAKGLPLKKRVFKAFVCSLQTDNTVTNVLVYDSNNSLSQYWWKEFLELTQLHSDEDNTETAFDAIDKSVFNKIKKAHPQDYMHLRNSTIRYFRASYDFEMENFLETAIGEYEPYDSNLNVDELKQKIRELPSKPRTIFDHQFTIVKSKVKARFLKKIPLTEQIELHLLQDVPNLETAIIAEQGSDGTKYVKIRSDSGYEYFNKPKGKR